MKVFHVELSDETAHWLARRIESGEYQNVSEYLAALVSNDCGQRMPDSLRRRLNEGIGSLDEGLGIKVTEETWRQKKRDFIARTGHRGEMA